MTNSDWNERHAASDAADGDVVFDPHALANAAADPALCGGSFWGEVLRDIPREGSSTNERLRIRARNARLAANAGREPEPVDAPVDLGALNLTVSLPGFAAADVKTDAAASASERVEPVAPEPASAPDESSAAEDHAAEPESESAAADDANASFSEKDLHFTVATRLSPERIPTPAELKPIDVESSTPGRVSDRASDVHGKRSWLDALREREAYEILNVRRPLFYAALAETFLFLPFGLCALYWLLRMIKALAEDDYSTADYAASKARTTLWIGKNAILVLFLLGAAAFVFLALSGVGDSPKV